MGLLDHKDNPYLWPPASRTRLWAAQWHLLHQETVLFACRKKVSCPPCSRTQFCCWSLCSFHFRSPSARTLERVVPTKEVMKVQPQENKFKFVKQIARRKTKNVRKKKTYVYICNPLVLAMCLNESRPVTHVRLLNASAS